MTDTPPLEESMNDTVIEPAEAGAEELSEEALLQKIVEYKNLAVRATADYRNCSNRPTNNIRQFATDQLLTELCPLVDYLIVRQPCTQWSDRAS